MTLRPTLLAASLAAALSSTTALAADLSVRIVNLTHGSAFTPILVAAHNSDYQLFSAGQPASTGLQEMAEGGSIATLTADIQSAGGVVIGNPAAGLLMPGASTTASIDSSDLTQLSVAAMILPSNDGFMTLNSITIPTTPGTYTYNLNAYDAGTEANDEIRGGGTGMPGMPVPPPLASLYGTGGTGVPGATAEGYVHIHRNVLGDSNPTGGVSDIDSARSRWLNPVARVIVTVQ